MSEIIEHESSKFALSIYECEWYEFGKKGLTQDVHIAMTALAKPLLINIFGFFPMNMKSYLQVSNTKKTQKVNKLLFVFGL